MQVYVMRKEMVVMGAFHVTNEGNEMSEAVCMSVRGCLRLRSRNIRTLIQPDFS